MVCTARRHFPSPSRGDSLESNVNFHSSQDRPSGILTGCFVGVLSLGAEAHVASPQHPYTTSVRVWFLLTSSAAWSRTGHPRAPCLSPCGPLPRRWRRLSARFLWPVLGLALG